MIQSWDTAATDGARSDYTVGMTIGETQDRNYYVLDCYRGRLLYPDLKRKVRELAELHGIESVLIEKASSGEALSQEMRLEGFYKVYPITPKGTKYERIIARTALMEAGRVWLPQQAHWVPEFLREACLFPNGRYDDQLDALTQALQWMSDGSSAAHFLWALEEVDRIRRERGDY